MMMTISVALIAVASFVAFIAARHLIGRYISLVKAYLYARAAAAAAQECFNDNHLPEEIKDNIEKLISRIDDISLLKGTVERLEKLPPIQRPYQPPTAMRKIPKQTKHRLGKFAHNFGLAQSYYHPVVGERYREIMARRAAEYQAIASEHSRRNRAVAVREDVEIAEWIPTRSQREGGFNSNACPA